MGESHQPRIGVVARDPTGGIALGGDHWSGGRYDGMTAYVGRLDPLGNLVWGISYPHGMWAADVTIAPEGRMAILAGSSETIHGDLVGSRWLTLSLYDPQGTELWSLWNTWPNLRYYAGYFASIELVDETLYLAFWSIDDSAASYQLRLELWSVGLDGSINWSRQYADLLGPEAVVWATSLAVAPSGDLMVGGSWESGFSSHDKNSFILRFSPEGELLENTVLGRPGVDDEIQDLVVMPDGRLYTIGQIDGRMWVAYHSTVTTAIDYEARPNPSRLAVYPNPGTGVLSVRPPSEFREPLEVQVLDLLGRVVIRRTLAGRELDLSRLGPGTYIVSVRSENRMANDVVILR